MKSKSLIKWGPPYQYELTLFQYIYLWLNKGNLGEMEEEETNKSIRGEISKQDSDCDWDKQVQIG
jgi:hypothetical protein